MFSGWPVYKWALLFWLMCKSKWIFWSDFQDLKKKGWLIHQEIWYFGNVLILYCLFLRYGINWAEYTQKSTCPWLLWVTKADWYFIVVASWIDVICCIVQHDEWSCDILKSLNESWWFCAGESYFFLALRDYPWGNLLAHFKTNKPIICWMADTLPLNSNKKGFILLTKNSSLNPLFLSAWLMAQYSGSLWIGIGLIVTNFPGPITSKKKQQLCDIFKPLPQGASNFTIEFIKNKNKEVEEIKKGVYNYYSSDMPSFIIFCMT